MGGQGSLPVVAEDDNKKFLGLVTRFHVMSMYNKELILLQGDSKELNKES